MPTKPFMAKFDQGDGNVHYHKCVRFFDGQVWTLDRYRRSLKRQQFRRSVIYRHLNKNAEGHYFEGEE